MSSYGRRSSHDDRRERDSRRDSSRRDSYSSRSRRSPSPGPSRSSSSSSEKTDSDKLPKEFGGTRLFDPVDTRLNVLQRMRDSYTSGPLGILSECVRKSKKLKVWTRNFREVKGILTGYLIAFDKHWNIVLNDVDEFYCKPKKNKTPFLRAIEADEILPDIPRKAPKKKKDGETSGETSTATEEKTDVEKEEKSEPVVKTEEATEGTDGEKGEKKKKRKRSKAKSKLTERHMEKVFLRGDNIVMIAPLEPEELTDSEEEKEKN